MRIAQIAPLTESCPPKLYGGTERIVSYLTEELVSLGHDVTLFASGDSVTAARLVSCVPEALRSSGGDAADSLAYQSILFHRVVATDFDVLHFHTDFLHFGAFERDADRTLTTLHGRLDMPSMTAVLAEFDAMPLVSISDAQRNPVPDAHFVSTIYHGVPASSYRLGAGGEYLAFVGRVSPEKRPDRAVQIAKAAGVPLHVAAKIDTADRAYFEREIEQLFDDPIVTFVGEIDDRRKDEFLGRARALLFPIDWPEPFGLVLIEAMATGTPVIAFRHGSVEEIVEDGVTGFVVDTVEQAVAAVARLGSLDRATVRRRFEERFSTRRMTEEYVALYDRSVRDRRAAVGRA